MFFEGRSFRVERAIVCDWLLYLCPRILSVLW